MKTKILLVRHGQSLGNLRETFLGYTDLDLTELGYRQAEALAKRLRDVPLDAVYSSDLCRAVNTVLPAARDHGLTVTPDKRLREIFAGEWEGVTFDEIARRFPADRALWKQNIGLSRPTGGESVTELTARVKAALDDIAESNPGKTVLVGTHATPVRSVMTRLRGYPPERMAEIDWAPNASITTVVYEDGVARLEGEADAAHLEGIVTLVPQKI